MAFTILMCTFLISVLSLCIGAVIGSIGTIIMTKKVNPDAYKNVDITNNHEPEDNDDDDRC